MARITNEERLMKLETQMTDVKEILKEMKNEQCKTNQKLNSYMITKLDREEFIEYKKSSSSWVKWVTPTVISLVTLAILILRG